MHSNQYTLEHHHHTIPIMTQRPRQQRQRNKRNMQPTYIPSSIHLSTPSSLAEDPFAKMSAYVDYQQKIESLKTSLAPFATKSTSKNDDPAQIPRPFDSTKERRHSQRSSLMVDMTGEDNGRYWGHGSVISSGSCSSNSSSGASSSGYLTPPRASSPPMTTTYDDDEQSSSCYVTMEDKLKFLAFLRHRTGWQHTAETNTVPDLDYMTNGGSLFYWHNGQ